MTPDPLSPNPPAFECPGRWIVFVPLVAALIATAGSLWLSLGMGLKACPLCFYQRAFVMGAAGALILGIFSRTAAERALAVTIAAFCAVAGLGVAGFHVSLEYRKALECPNGLLDFGTAPTQSLAVLVVLFGGLVAAGWGAKGRLVLAIVLGAAAAFGSIASAPPLPAAPAKPYTDPLVTCRPPYVAPT